MRREDPRPAQTRELVLRAARLIIASEGQAAVSPTRLVEMSGVARSTIYRHWTDANAIIADAMAAEAHENHRLESTGDPAVDLRNYLQELRDVLESPGAPIIIAQAEIAEREDDAARTLIGNNLHRRERIKDLLNDPRDDFAVVHTMLVGPLFMTRYFSRESITDELLDSIVAGYMAGRHDID